MKRITGKIIAIILTGGIILTTFMSAGTVYAGELELVEVNEDAVNSENTSSPEYDESAVEEDTEAGETTKDEADEVYADNKGKTYKIKYVLKGGKNNSKNPKTYTGKKKIVLKAASKKGYSFKGWYKDKKYKKKLKVIKKGSKGNITAYAKWAANKYTIKYDANGGTG
nr:InlB B-repeat-containing protein [Lachnospiraceae bacterium]